MKKSLQCYWDVINQGCDLYYYCNQRCRHLAWCALAFILVAYWVYGNSSCNILMCGVTVCLKSYEEYSFIEFLEFEHLGFILCLWTEVHPCRCLQSSACEMCYNVRSSFLYRGDQRSAGKKTCSWVKLRLLGRIYSPSRSN